MDDDQIMQQQEAPGGETDDFLDGWDETDAAEASEEDEDPAPAGDAETPAETPESAPGGETSAGGEEGQAPGGEESSGGENPPPPPPRTWTLNHQGQPVTIGEADVPALAQKGLEYDRIRAEYDEARPVIELFQGFAKQAGIPLTDYVARLRTQAKRAQGMEEAEARRVVEMEDREARLAAQEAEDRRRQEAAQRAQAFHRQRQERVQADIQEFIAVFPDAARDFQSIPKEVWDAVNGGMSLVAAYARHAGAQAAEKAKAQAEEAARQEAVRQQNAANAARSAGSMKSAGQNHGPKDPFLEGWDED